MTQILLAPDALVVGDMNGPLAYWGPVTASPAATFTGAELALLQHLRTRLAHTPVLTEAVATLLTAPALLV